VLFELSCALWIMSSSFPSIWNTSIKKDAFHSKTSQRSPGISKMDLQTSQRSPGISKMDLKISRSSLESPRWICTFLGDPLESQRWICTFLGDPWNLKDGFAHFSEIPGISKMELQISRQFSDFLQCLIGKTLTNLGHNSTNCNIFLQTRWQMGKNPPNL